MLKREKLETFLNDLGKLGAKSDISKILVTSLVRILKNPNACVT